MSYRSVLRRDPLGSNEIPEISLVVVVSSPGRFRGSAGNWAAVCDRRPGATLQGVIVAEDRKGTHVRSPGTLDRKREPTLREIARHDLKTTLPPP